jgi:proteasome lid subunit RPN8/RPN11
VIRLSPGSLRALYAEGCVAYPSECCGLLVGTPGEAAGVRQSVRVVTLPNHRQGGRRRRYLIAAEDVQRTIADAERDGLSLVGVYHSHPDAPAKPSLLDRDSAWPWFVYVIISVIGGRSLEARAWRLRDDRMSFIEEEIVIEEADS